MVVLAKMPTQAIVDGLKGTLDFYLYKGLAVCRKWPVYAPRQPHPAESVNQQNFSYINKLWITLPVHIQDGYRQMAVGTPYTAKDLLVMSFMKGIHLAAE